MNLTVSNKLPVCSRRMPFQVIKNMVPLFQHHHPSMFRLSDKDQGEDHVYILTHDPHSTSYARLRALVDELLKNDCQAVVLGNEIVFNEYRTVSRKEKLMEDMMMDYIKKTDSHYSLLVHLIDDKMDGSMDLYFSTKEQAWKVNVAYTFREQEFIVTYWCQENTSIDITMHHMKEVKQVQTEQVEKQDEMLFFTPLDKNIQRVLIGTCVHVVAMEDV